eukprot:544183-Hanusia_phi.AAC.1
MEGNWIVSGSTLSTRSGAEKSDVYVSKLLVGGEHLWTTLVSTPQNDTTATGMTVGDDGSVYVMTGSSGGSYLTRVGSCGKEEWSIGLGEDVGSWGDAYMTYCRDKVYASWTDTRNRSWLVQVGVNGSVYWTRLLGMEEGFVRGAVCDQAGA